MKKYSFLLAFTLLSLAYNTLQAQLSSAIELNGRKVYYQGERVKSPKDLEQIIQQANDPEANQLMHDLRKQHTVGTVFMVGGLGLSGIGLISQLQGASKGESKGLGLVLGGAGLVLVGAIIQATGWQSKGKAAIKRYNSVVAPEAPLSWRLEPASSGMGLALRF